MKINLRIRALAPLVFFMIVGAILLRCFFQAGFPYTHDGESHLARLANFHLAAIDKHFPIRWAPNLNYKFGYPVFHFNYYMPYLLALIPIKIGLSFETSFKIVIFASFVAGGVFWYLLLRKYFGKLPAVVGGLFYMTAPYQLVNILIRGSMGEIVALGMLPFLLWVIERLIRETSRLNFLLVTMGMVALFITHNITAIFGLPILGLYSLILVWQKKIWRKLPILILSFCLGIGVTLFFWIPALLEKQYTNMDKIGMSYEYLDHFPTLKQILHSPWRYGFSVPGPDDEMNFGLGPFHWIIGVGASALFLVATYKKRKIDWLWLFFLSLFWGAILFMNEITLPLWKITPMVRYIQFPWRLLGFAIVATAFLGAKLAKEINYLGLFLGCGALIYMAILVKPFGWFNWDNYYYYEWPFTSSIKGLNMPIWFDLEKNHKLKGKIHTLESTAYIKEFEWKTQRHVYEVNALGGTQIWERTAYFPGWEVYVNDKKTEINYNHPDYPGVIVYSIPPGKHLVTTIFTENTQPRRLGNTLSLIASILFLGTLLTGRFFDHGTAAEKRK